MLRTVGLIWEYKLLWIALGVIFVATAFTNIFVGGLLSILFLFFFGSKQDGELFVLLLFLGSCFFATDTRGILSGLSDFRFIVIGIATLIFALQYRLPKYPTLQILPFSLYAVLISLTFGTSPYVEAAEGAVFLVVAVVLFGLIDRSYKQIPVKTQQAILGFSVLFIGINILLLIFPLGNYFLEGRFRGLMGNPNELGLLAMFLYGFFHFIEKRNESFLNRGFFLFSKIIFVVVIIATGSRTALFGVILYEIIYRLFFSKVKLSFSIVMFGIIFYLIINYGIIDFIESVGLYDGLRIDTFSSGSGRVEVWEVVWEEIKAHPFLGGGMEYDIEYIRSYTLQYIGENASRSWNAVWSSYLSLLLNVGMIGFVFYFYFIFKMFMKAVDKRTATAFLMMALFAGITESWMISAVNTFTPLVFVYWALQSQPKLQHNSADT